MFFGYFGSRYVVIVTEFLQVGEVFNCKVYSGDIELCSDKLCVVLMDSGITIGYNNDPLTLGIIFYGDFT